MRNLAIAYALQRRKRKHFDDGGSVDIDPDKAKSVSDSFKGALGFDDGGEVKPSPTPNVDPDEAKKAEESFKGASSEGWSNLKHAFGYAEGGKIKGVHEQVNEMHPGMSSAGLHSRLPKEIGEHPAGKEALEEAKERHSSKLSELRSMPAPKLKGLAHGGYSTKAKSFISDRMHVFGQGKMHSGSKEGPEVTNPKQAVAIAMSEARSKHMKVPKAYARGGRVDEMASGYLPMPEEHEMHNEMAEHEDDKRLNQRMPMIENSMRSSLVDRLTQGNGKESFSRLDRLSRGGQVANQEHGENDNELAGFSPNEFDDLVLRDDLDFSYDGENSGDYESTEGEDERRHDIVSKILKSQRKGPGKLPRPYGK